MKFSQLHVTSIESNRRFFEEVKPDVEATLNIEARWYRDISLSRAIFNPNRSQYDSIVTLNYLRRII